MEREKETKDKAKNSRTAVATVAVRKSRADPKLTDDTLPKSAGADQPWLRLSDATSSLPHPSLLCGCFSSPLGFHPLKARPSPISDSDNSLLRYLSDDKILVIEEEPEGLGRESRRDSTRRSRRKSRNPSSPSFPLSPSMLSSTLRLDQPPDALPVRRNASSCLKTKNKQPVPVVATSEPEVGPPPGCS